MNDRFIVTYSTDQGWIGQRWCDFIETAEQLARTLLGIELEHGTINIVTISQNDRLLGEFEF